MTTIRLALLLGLCCLMGCRKEPEVDIPYDPASPRILELRIIGHREFHRGIFDLALEQLSKETTAGKPWTDLVVEPTKQQPIARWVRIHPKAESWFLESPTTFVRTPPDDETKKQVLVILDPFNVTSDYIARARPGEDEKGAPCVYFTMTGYGSIRLEKLTGSNLPQNEHYRSLGIILDGVVMSAPRIVNTIANNGMFSGHFTPEEARHAAELMMVKATSKVSPTPTKAP